MDSSEWDRTSLLERLRQVGRQTPFFRAVPLLEQIVDEAAPVGLDGPPSKERIRFRHDPGLHFSSGDISSIDIVRVPQEAFQDAREVYEVVTTFLGLTGSISPLPNFFSELILHENQDEPVRRDLLDVFHHRAISLLFRGVRRMSIPGAHRSRQTSPWLKRALCLGGVDAYEASVGKNLPLANVMRMLPLLVGRARGARGLMTALECVLEPVLGEKGRVTLSDHVESWAELGADQRMVLGRQNNRLGRNTQIGSRARERSGKFEIQVGPISQEAYRKFLPGGGQLGLVRETVELFTRNPLDYDIKLTVSSGTGGFALGGKESASLGRTTWLGARARDREIVLRDAGRPDENGRADENGQAA